MKITARSATQVPGFGIVRRGHAIEWPDDMPFPPQVEGNFNDPDGKPLDSLPPRKPATDGAQDKGEEKDEAKKDAKLLVKRTAAIGRAKLAAKLDALHVAYDEKMSATELAKTLLRQNGEKID